MKDVNKSMRVSEYKLFNYISEELQGKLPSIEDIEKRIIHVTVSAKNKFVLIQFQNYCEVKPNEDKRGVRLFESSKADKRNHGFGLKSIQYTVDKYDGTMKAGMNKAWFELTILIPCSNK